MACLARTRRRSVLGHSARCERIGFRRHAGQWPRLLARFIEWLVGRVGDGVDGGIGLHDERPEDGNGSHPLSRNHYSCDSAPK
jgi:hypothetical protein